MDGIEISIPKAIFGRDQTVGMFSLGKVSRPDGNERPLRTYRRNLNENVEAEFWNLVL